VIDRYLKTESRSLMFLGENCERKCRIKRFALFGWLSERTQVWKTPYPYSNAIIVAERIRDTEIRNSIGRLNNSEHYWVVSARAARRAHSNVGRSMHEKRHGAVSTLGL
jgi:hypothetical protein